MKRLTTAIPAMLLLCGSASMHAQTTSSKIQQHNAALIRAIESRQHARLDAAKGATARTTGIPAPLIAESQSDGDGNVYDTARYTYSGGRSSSFDFSFMKYNIFPYSINQGYPLYINIGTDADAEVANTTGVFCDAEFTYAFVANAWSPLDTTVGVYDNNNNLIQLSDGFTRSITTYDANQHPVTVLYLSSYSNEWDTTSERYFTFNGNQVVSDSTAMYLNNTWAPFSVWSYNYDNNNNLTQAAWVTNNGGGWVPQERYELSYNADNLLVGDSAISFISNTWVPIQTDSLGYTAGVNYVTYWYEINFNGNTGAPENHFITMKHISGGLPDSVYSTNIQLSNGTTGGMKTHYVYNSDGNPTVGAQYNYNPNIGDYDPTPDAYQHYYYQSTTAVSNVAKQDVAIKVYPNPAANEINISMTGTQHGALTYITLINALGQTVHTESLPWISKTQTISTTGMKPGNYWLMVQDKSGNVLGRQAVVKE